MFSLTKESSELTEKFLLAIHRLYGWEYIPDEEILAERRKVYGWIIDKCVLRPLGQHAKQPVMERLEHLPFPPPINSISDFLLVQVQMIAVITLMNASTNVEEFKTLFDRVNSADKSL